MHLRIPNTPLTIVGDPCQASSVPFSGHVEVACKPAQQADISSIQLALVRTTKIKKAAAPKAPDALLASRRRSFGNHSPTRDKRTSVEELQRWTIAYPPSAAPTTTTTTTRPGLIRRSSSDKNTVLVPFHIRIPGHLPATTTTPLGSTSYALAATALSASTGKPLLRTETPLTLRRALHLPLGPASVVLRRRFPESLVSTRLAVPGVVRAADAFTARLAVGGSVTRRGRTATHLALRRLDWRVEERTAVVVGSSSSSPPPFSEVEAGSAGATAERDRERERERERDAQCSHVRKLAQGKWEGGGWTGNLDKLPAPAADGGDVEVEFHVAVPASAKALCSVDPRFGPPTTTTTGEPGGEHSAASLAVSHVLVLELITVELKYNVDSGELVNMYPFPQRKFGAVYDITVADWDYDGGGSSAQTLTLPPCGEVLGERPPSYDSVAVM
ncbi:arrestin (or s-antigen) n-terminal domain protein [Neofusicoccum parvum]|nr:arrestin (or s-antigen) n-terminal domain protein [Neofusicoccum parvum]